MRKKTTTFLKIACTFLIVSVWGSEFLNYSLVGQVRAQDTQFVDPEQVFEEYMETFDREQSVLEKESNRQVTRESVAEDIVIEAEAQDDPQPAAVMTVP